MDDIIDVNDIIGDKYPLDYSKLYKGQRLTIEELEKVFGLKYPNKDWNWECRGLVSGIEQHRGFIARGDSYAIYIMTDAEAAEYIFETTFKSGVRKVRRATRNQALIDTSQLSGTEMKNFESQSRIASGTNQAMNAYLKKQKTIERLLAAKRELTEEASG